MMQSAAQLPAANGGISADGGEGIRSAVGSDLCQCSIVRGSWRSPKSLKHYLVPSFEKQKVTGFK
jgi:hypothetical protein